MKEELPIRKKNRMEKYDYARAGKYFVTICVSNRVQLLWEDVDEYGEYWELSKYGHIVECGIQRVGQIYKTVSIDKFCVMPDHIHAIISIEKNMCRGEQCSPDGRDLPENESVNLSRVIKQMKGIITKEIGFSIWQKSYYDHVIRNEIEYARIWQYIEENPIKRLMGKSGRNDLTFLD